MKKQTKRVQVILFLVVMLLPLVMPANTQAFANLAGKKTIVFQSKLVYDAVVAELNRRSADITSQDDEKLTLVLSEESINSVKGISIEYEKSDRIEIDFSGIENFTSISRLVVIGGKNIFGESERLTIKDLTPIAALTQLEVLTLDQVVIPSGVSALNGLTELRGLSVSGVSNFDTKVLLNKNKLTTLKLNSCAIDNEGLADIGKITSLQYLILGGPNYENNNISDITPIGNLTNLTELWIDNNNISDISVLSNLTNLRTLSIRCNQIRDLSPLSNLNNLKELILGRDVYAGSKEGNPIESMEPIKNLPLTRLSASRCGIEDISFLSSMSQLWELDLSGNSISDFSPLDGRNSIQMKISAQEFTDTADSGTRIAMPECMEKAFNDPDFIGYIADAQYSCKNCSVSDDHKYITIDQNVTSASVELSGREGIGGSRYVLSVQDVNSPVLTIEYNPAIITEGSVQVQIIANETIQAVDGFLLIGSRNRLAKNYTENMKENVKVYDLAGNYTIAEINVNNIQIPTEAPTEEITEAPTEETTEAPTEETTEAPTEETTEAPTEETTEAPTEERTEAPTEETTEAPTQAAVITPTVVADDDDDDDDDEIVTEPTTAMFTEAVTAPATEPVTEAETKVAPATGDVSSTGLLMYIVIFLMSGLAAVLSGNRRFSK